MAHSPAREKATIAAPHHPQPLRVNEVTGVQGCIEPCHDVGEVTPTPVANDCTRERLTIALTATRVGVDHHISRPSIYLKLVKERIAILRMRPTADVQQRGVALTGCKAIGFHHPAVERVSSTLIAQAL